MGAAGHAGQAQVHRPAVQLRSCAAASPVTECGEDAEIVGQCRDGGTSHSMRPG